MQFTSPVSIPISGQTSLISLLLSFLLVFKSIKFYQKDNYTYVTRGGGGTPLYGLYRYVQTQRVWFFSRFGHKQGIDFSHFAAILVLNRVSIFALQSSVWFCLLEEATSSSRPSSPICALPSSTLFNACQIRLRAR